jgi:sugar phosphate permease
MAGSWPDHGRTMLAWWSRVGRGELTAFDISHAVPFATPTLVDDALIQGLKQGHPRNAKSQGKIIQYSDKSFGQL